MGKLEAFQIVFDHPQAVFYAGQMVSGHVKLVLNEAMKMRGVVLTIFGKGKVHWSVASGKTRKHYRAEEIYCNTRIDLLRPAANEECLTLQAGSFNLPFQMLLLPSLPSSFEGKYGYVRYVVEVKVDRPWKFDHEAKAAFTVLSILDLNLELPFLREPCPTHVEKDVSCCCCISGIVDTTVTINRKCFVPGETIFMTMKVTNNSNSFIPNCTATLEQLIEFLAHSTSFFSSGQYHAKTRREVVAQVQMGSVAEGRTEEFRDVALSVPSIPPSRLVGCQIINISYYLVFDVKVDYTEVKVPVEVVIGTIPLRGQYSQGHVIVSQPTAPSLPAPTFQNNPPPFNAVAGLYHDLPPPSYEECVQGRVTIKEETDSEYLRGDLNWAPVYPMYRTTSLAPTD